MDLLPDDIVLKILLEIPWSANVIINRRYKRLLWDNQYFWREKFRRDYGYLPHYDGNWRYLYKNYNSLYVMGLNDANTLLLGYTPYSMQLIKLQTIKAKQITDNYLIGMDDYIYRFGEKDGPLFGFFEPVRFGPDKINFKAKDIKSCNNYAIIIDLNDYAHTLTPGSDQPKPLTNFPVKYVAIGGPKSDNPSRAFIDFDDNLYVYGNNNYGMLGLGLSDTVITQPRLVLGIKARMIAFSTDHGVVLATDGRLYVAGFQHYGLPMEWRNLYTFTELPNIRAKFVACGSFITSFIDLNNDLYIIGQIRYVHYNGILTYDSVYYRLKKILAGCASVSIAGSMVVFTDIKNNVYTFGQIVEVKRNEVYTIYDSGIQNKNFNIMAITKFKADKVYCTKYGGIMIIGTSIV